MLWKKISDYIINLEIIFQKRQFSLVVAKQVFNEYLESTYYLNSVNTRTSHKNTSLLKDDSNFFLLGENILLHILITSIKKENYSGTIRLGHKKLFFLLASWIISNLMLAI